MHTHKIRIGKIRRHRMSTVAIFILLMSDYMNILNYILLALIAINVGGIVALIKALMEVEKSLDEAERLQAMSKAQLRIINESKKNDFASKIRNFPITQSFELYGACRYCDDCEFEFDIDKTIAILGENQYTIKCSCANKKLWGKIHK